MYNALIALVHGRANSTQFSYEMPPKSVRIPIVTNVTFAQDSPGGFTEGSFTIPALYAGRIAASDLQSGLYRVWVFQGGQRIYYGLIDTAAPGDGNEIVVAAKGHYQDLYNTRMREIWSDSDLSKWTPSHTNTPGCSMEVSSAGRLVFKIPKNSKGYNSGDQITADYYLFNEPSGTRDTKKITGFIVKVIDGNYTLPNIEFRVVGKSNPTDTTPTTLHTNQGTDIPWTRFETSLHKANGDNTQNWPDTSGYRLIRIGLYVTGKIDSLDSDHTASVSLATVTTRGNTDFFGKDAPDTADMVRDMFDQAEWTLDLPQTTQEMTNTGSGVLITGNIPDSGTNADSIGFQQWTSPGEVLDTLSALDGNNAAMWFPSTRIAAGAKAVADTTYNHWYFVAPELVYAEWGELSTPDYLAYMIRGALWAPDNQSQQLISALYVNYTTIGGREQSLFVEDASAENWLYAQGIHRAEDWQIDPPVSTVTAQTLATQYLVLRRQPTLSGTLTIRGDRPGALQTGEGDPVRKLATVQTGTIVRIPDADHYRAGRVTQATYTSRTSSDPEMLVLSVNSPTFTITPALLASIARRHKKSRKR